MEKGFGVRVWESSVQHAGNAWGEGVAARPGNLLRESGVVLKGAGVCVCVQQLHCRLGNCGQSFYW